MNKRGFSLLEIMIAVAILSGMALIINTTMTRSLTGKARVEKRDELLHTVRITLNKMTEDLSQAFLSNSTLKGQNSIYETGMKGTESKIDFSTLGHLHYQKDAKDTDQVTVGYGLAAGESDFQNLTRRESSRLSEKIDEGGREFVLLENVKAFKLSYYDSNKEEWVAEWDTSQVSNLNRLPQVVKIELTVVDREDEENSETGREYYFSTMAPVDLYQNEISF